MPDFLHIGLPKAASTWLQDVLFQGHPELCVLGGGGEEPTLREALVKEVRRLALGQDLSCDVEAFERRIRALLEQKCPGTRRTGLSHEVLAGTWPWGGNRRLIAEALARCFPKARVLIVLREQRDMLVSSYREYVRLGGCASFRGFLLDPWIAGGFVHDDEPLRSHVIESLRYEPLVRCYQDLFGPERVLVCCMEDLRRDRAGFAARILRFLQVRDDWRPPAVETNRQLSGPGRGLLRLANRFFSTQQHPRSTGFVSRGLSRLLASGSGGANAELRAQRFSSRAQRWVRERLVEPVDRALLRHLPGSRTGEWQTLPEAVRTWIEEHYRDDNRQLAERTGLDLTGRGYLLGTKQEPIGPQAALEVEEAQCVQSGS